MRFIQPSFNDLQADRNKAYLGGELGQQREKLNPSSASPGAGGMGATGPPPDLWIGHVDQLELKAMDDGDETGETSIRSASSMAERSRQFGLPYSGKNERSPRLVFVVWKFAFFGRAIDRAPIRHPSTDPMH